MKSSTVRRSVALPEDVIADAVSVAPPALRRNLNRLVRVALEEFAARGREREFERALEAMSADPEIQREARRIDEDFRGAEADGLSR